jgi:hypothetical protein
MRMSRADRTALGDLDRLSRLIEDLRRNYTAAVVMADDVSISSSVESPASRSGSHADPTARTALDGRRQNRRASVRRSRKAIAASLRQLQEALWHACSVANED